MPENYLLVTKFLVTLFLLICGIPAHAISCHNYTVDDPDQLSDIDKEFGVPYDVISDNGKLLLKAECSESGVSIVVGNNEDNLLIYKKGYYLDPDTKKWKQMSFFGVPHEDNNNWIVGKAFRSIPEIKSTFYLAYTCLLDEDEDEWKCGCRDKKCFGNTGSLWNIQKVKSFSSQLPIIYEPQNMGWRFMSHADYNSGKVYHPGADINVAGDASCKKPVKSIAYGKVVANTKLWGGIVIKHKAGGKTYYSQYGHIQHLKNESHLSVGKWVQKGDNIGYVCDWNGMTGVPFQDGVKHLHFEIRTAQHPDPDNAVCWNSCSGISKRKKTFKSYDNPFSFVESYLDPYRETIIIDDSVTYPSIEDDIVNNKIYEDQKIIKENFFISSGLNESNCHSKCIGYGENTGYGGNHHYVVTTDGDQETAFGKWHFYIPKSGTYELYANIPNTDSTSTNSSYEIYHSRIYSYSIVNQKKIDDTLSGNRWVSLGRYDFEEGNNHYIKLSNNTGKNNRSIGYDAIKLVFLWSI